MELKDFIAQTISQVMEGVNEAQKLAEKVGGAVNPKGQLYLTADSAPFMDKETTRIGDFINFDVAIEVNEEKEESGGAKISVPSIGGFGGKLFRKRQNKSMSRVNFRLPIIYPKGSYKENESITYPLHSTIHSNRHSNSDSSSCNMTTSVESFKKPFSATGEEG
jgi:hypothetical protein